MERLGDAGLLGFAHYLLGVSLHAQTLVTDPPDTVTHATHQAPIRVGAIRVDFQGLLQLDNGLCCSVFENKRRTGGLM